MKEILQAWLFFGERPALEELHKFDMRQRNDMVAKAQAFADWLALQSSREINK